MAYPSIKYHSRHYSVSDSHPEIALHQQVPRLAEVKLYYIHTMLVLPLADKFGMPYITSAFRDIQLNSLIGKGSRQHMAGEAVDFLWPENNQTVQQALQFIKDKMFYQTGWCYLKIDLNDKQFKHIHWALPLSPDATPRKNPEKFWYYYNGSFHLNPPMEVHEWQMS